MAGVSAPTIDCPCLGGVRLVTSDSHLGLKQAVAEILVGATRQRCGELFACSGWTTRR